MYLLGLPISNLRNSICIYEYLKVPELKIEDDILTNENLVIILYDSKHPKIGLFEDFADRHVR